ncbi:MAG: gamma-glutamyltransferase [Verrucomicrobia bacterium]|nr:gamma-glutamyltransferase [Verrucomicrobiota bacterium]
MALGLLAVPLSGATSGNPLPAKPVEGRSGMVASAHPLATQAGLEILRQGGNAVDAAVATAFALGVVEPNASGLGGGGYIVFYHAKTGKAEAIDYREKAPRKATADMYPLSPDGKGVLNKASTVGHRACAVPGNLAGLSLALQRWGTKRLPEVLAPAIRLAEEGYPVTKTLADMMNTYYDRLAQFPEASRVYLKDGLAYEPGEKLVLKDLAKTLRLIAARGPEVFYRGEIAEAIVREMAAGGGLITREDLADYQPVVREPVRGTYRGHELISMPSSSSGGTHVIQLLNILEGYDLAALGHNTAAALHVQAEAAKRVFADRAKYSGDADFVKVPTAGLLSKEYAAELRKGINPEKATEKVAAGNPYSVMSGNTTHASFVDREGNLVALTQTINLFFASGVVVPGYGILLNDEMDDFMPVPGNANSIAPGKRPASSMSPTIVLKDGRPFLSLGSPGSARIITALPQILMNVIDHRMDLQQAINAPRAHCMGGAIEVESRIPETVRAELQSRGHKLSVRGAVDLHFGGAQAVMIEPGSGRLLGAADPRRDGVAAGY